MIKFLLNCLIVEYHDFHCLFKKNYHPKLKGEVNNLLIQCYGVYRLGPRYTEYPHPFNKR